MIAGMAGGGMALPILREELSLHPGSPDLSGAPTWVLRDPVRNRFFRLDWLSFEVLARWGLGSPTAIAAAIETETTLSAEEADILQVIEFLQANELVRAASPAETSRLAAIARARRHSWGHWLLHHYLFFRIPLVYPDRFLNAALPWTGWAFSRRMGVLSGVALLAGLLLVIRQWDRFAASLVDTLTVSGMASYALALAFAKVVHELAHGLTAKRLGCRVPSMGVAFLVMWPVLYTDVNEAWKLPERRQRLAIGAAGIVAELAIAAWSSLAWAFLPEGPLRQMAFILATTTWVSSLAINLSPFMRFDGYFLLMDWLDLPNLHGRAFALARWWIREALFRLGEPPPEPLPPNLTRKLVIFAMVVWIYRLVVFLGIAVLVYHFFIKVVGVLLFAVEIGWFVLLPVVGEVKEWAKRKDAIAASPRRWAVPAGMVLLSAALLVPWQGQVHAPAMLKAERSAGLFVPVGARLAQVPPSAGATVAEGQVLFVFDNPDLVTKRAGIEARVKTLQWELESVAFSSELREKTLVLREQRAAALAELASLDGEGARLSVAAPFAGRLVDVEPGLAMGDWLSPKTRLATVRSDEWKGEAFVDGEDLERVAVGDTALFVAQSAPASAIRLVVSAIDRSPVRTLSEPELASVHGGSLSVRASNGGGLVPEAAVYRVRLAPVAPIDATLSRPGHVIIEGTRTSLLGRLLRSAALVVVRELAP